MNFLQDLNLSIDNVINEIENDENMQNSDYFNFVKNAMDTICNSVSYYPEKTKQEIPVIHEDKMFEIILNFFSSVDADFYDKTNKILNNNYPNTKAYIYDFHKDDPKELTHYSIHYFNGKAEIFFPLGYKMSKEKVQTVRAEYGDDFYTLDDLYSIAHELAHLLDINPENFTPEPSPTREMLAEVTPGVFENLLTDYLLKNGLFDKDAIKNKKSSINNKLLTHAHLTRLKLLLAEIKKNKGSISKDDILKIMENELIAPEHFKDLMYLIAYSDTNITTGKRYAISRMCSPIIYEKCKTNSNLLKKYLTACAENLPFTDILKDFGIDFSRQTTIIKENDEPTK